MQNNTDSNPLIAFDDVHKKYPTGLEILSGINFSVQDGNFVTIIGKSGCGKSTILKIIAGLEEPSAGKVVLPPKVSVVFQSGALLPWLSVVDNVAFGLRMQNRTVKESRLEAEKFIEIVGLTAAKDQNPKKLSGGQRQRVGIARALAIKPKVLILDEPFSALDESSRHELQLDLLKIWGMHGLTVVMVSHQIEEAVLLSQRIILMDNHKIKKDFKIELPYPRDPKSNEYLDLVKSVREDFPSAENS